MPTVPIILLFLFTLNLGIAFGAGLYESKIVIPQWFVKLTDSGYRVNNKAMHELESGRNFWAFVTTVPLTLLTLINLVLAWQSQQSNQSWWLAATSIVFLERLSTFFFFIPTALKLQQVDKHPAARTNRLIHWWIRANYVRNALTLAGWILALIALMS